MAYKYDRDLEFLKQLESSDLLDLFEVLVLVKTAKKDTMKNSQAP